MYSATLIQRLLLEYNAILYSTNETIVIVRCDMLLALRRLPSPLRRIAATVMYCGTTDEDENGALVANAVTEEEMRSLTSALHRILNKEGLGG